MEKVIPLIKYFKTIFYLKKFEPEKVPFESVKVWKDSNFISISLKFEFKSNWTPPPYTVVGAHPSKALPCFGSSAARARRSRPGAGPPPPTVAGRGPSPLLAAAWPRAATRHPADPHTPCLLFLSQAPPRLPVQWSAPSSPKQRLPSSRPCRSEPTAPHRSPPPPCHVPRLPRSAADWWADAPRPSHHPELLSVGTTESYRTDRTPPAGEPSFDLHHLRTRRPTPKPASPAARIQPPIGSSEPLSPHPRAPPSGHPFRWGTLPSSRSTPHGVVPLAPAQRAIGSAVELAQAPLKKTTETKKKLLALLICTCPFVNFENS
jgi:hypothetical protein